jgi:hypothetical protein
VRLNTCQFWKKSMYFLRRTFQKSPSLKLIQSGSKLQSRATI